MLNTCDGCVNTKLRPAFKTRRSSISSSQKTAKVEKSCSSSSSFLSLSPFTTTHFARAHLAIMSWRSAAQRTGMNDVPLGTTRRWGSASTSDSPATPQTNSPYPPSDAAGSGLPPIPRAAPPSADGSGLKRSLDGDGAAAGADGGECRSVGQNRIGGWRWSFCPAAGRFCSSLMCDTSWHAAVRF